MIKKYGKNNYNLIIEKMKKIHEISMTNVLNELEKEVICVGSGSSYTTAYLSSKLLNKYFNKNAYVMTPRELLNENIKENTSIIIYSYSGTSKDTVKLREIYSNSIIITGRNIDEFENTENIFSYYLNFEYERGLILYENVIIPILLLAKEVDELKSIVDYEINNFDLYKVNLKNAKNIAIFTGDYANAATLDLTEKILETGIVKYDLYDKKNFSHGQYNYYKNNTYDLVLYFKQKNVSEYENILINKLDNLLIVESEFNGFNSSIDLLFKSFTIYNNLLNKYELNLFDSEYKELYNFTGDFK